MLAESAASATHALTCANTRAAYRNRTDDLFITSESLYRLS